MDRRLQHRKGRIPKDAERDRSRFGHGGRSSQRAIYVKEFERDFACAYTAIFLCFTAQGRNA